VGGNALDILGSLLFIAWLASPIFAVDFLVWKHAIGTFFALVCLAACLALAVYAAAAVHGSGSSLSGLVFVVEPVYAFIGLGVMLVLRAGLRTGPRPGL
jgi:hypothetical protein